MINTLNSPQRFPVKAEFGHKGGSILWSDAEPLLNVWQSLYGEDSTDYRPSMIKIACDGGLPASMLDSLQRKLKQERWFMSDENDTADWRRSFLADDPALWKETALRYADGMNVEPEQS
jgi:hypothetical protein